MISAVFCHVFHLDPAGQFINVMVIFIWTLVPLFILFFGLKKGVAWASNWNIRADILMLLAILICGPTAFILNQSIDGLGLMLQNFVAMSLSTDAIGRSGFPQMWTVFLFFMVGRVCHPIRFIYRPYFKRKDDPAIDCMWNSGRFIGMHGFLHGTG